MSVEGIHGDFNDQPVQESSIRQDTIIESIREIEVEPDKPTGPLRAAQEYHAPNFENIIKEITPIEIKPK